jgi:Berberine and berberine like
LGSLSRLRGPLVEDDAAVRASHGANHVRLARIKAVCDPDNRFRLNQNIRPEAVPEDNGTRHVAAGCRPLAPIPEALRCP